MNEYEEWCKDFNIKLTLYWIDITVNAWYRNLCNTEERFISEVGETHEDFLTEKIDCMNQLEALCDRFSTLLPQLDLFK